MIVKNEEKTLPRLTESLRGIPGYWVIVDTGSTDSTLSVIQEALKDIPGELHERPWVDFGHNRSELMSYAKDKAEWLLLMDADQILQGSVDPDSLSPANIDQYLLEEKPNDTVSYWIPRLIRGDLGWKYVGPTHEYLALAEGQSRRAKLDSLKVTHVGDGGSKADKFGRDRILLEKVVQNTPGDSRSWFYLGQTYFDLGMYAEAYDAYSKRVSLGGWDEEVYYSRYRMGSALARQERHSEAILMWLRAWQFRPSRLEALHSAIRQLRIDGNYHAAYALATFVGDTKPSDDLLFVESSVWKFDIFQERAICAYYVRGPRECLLESEALLRLSDLPPYIREFAEKNVAASRAALASAGTYSTEIRTRAAKNEALRTPNLSSAPAIQSAETESPEKYPNWFAQYAQGYFERNLGELAGKPNLRCLQIGAFAGDSTMWLMNNVLTESNSTLTDVDTWEGGGVAATDSMDFSDVEKVYNSRTSSFMSEDRLKKFKGTSIEFFRQTSTEQAFDFIYIDGDHTAFGVINDATSSYLHLKIGGMLAFDDYTWGPDLPRTQTPGPAVDAIMDLYLGRLEKVEVGTQVWLKKIA